LPALPAELPDGEVKGICARGGFVLDIKWQQGKLQQVTVLSTTGNICNLKYGVQEVTILTRKNDRFTLFGSLKYGRYTFNGKLKKAKR
jgi:alpha-L-fucosidase 2